VIGETTIEFKPNGLITYSSVPSWEAGNYLYDYLQPAIVELVKERLGRAISDNQLFTHEHQSLHFGKFVPRIAQVSYNKDNDLFTAVSTDAQQTNNVILYQDLKTINQNQFTVSSDGIILKVAHPKKTIMDAVGMNLFDILYPSYVSRVREKVRRCIQKKIMYPVETMVCVAGKTIYETGIIMPAGDDTVILDLKRIAVKENEEQNTAV